MAHKGKDRKNFFSSTSPSVKDAGLFGLFAIIILAAALSSTSDPTSGGWISPGSPTGGAISLGAGLFVPSSTITLTPSQISLDASPTATMDVKVARTYVWHQFYIIGKGPSGEFAFIPKEFKPKAETIQGSGWIANSASTQLAFTRTNVLSSNNFVFAYSCAAIPGGFDCNQNKWGYGEFTVKAVDLSVEVSGPSTPPVIGQPTDVTVTVKSDNPAVQSLDNDFKLVVFWGIAGGTPDSSVSVIDALTNTPIPLDFLGKSFIPLTLSDLATGNGQIQKKFKVTYSGVVRSVNLQATLGTSGDDGKPIIEETSTNNNQATATLDLGAAACPPPPQMAAPPQGCNYKMSKDSNGCTIYGELVCESPTEPCPAQSPISPPPEGCSHEFTTDAKGCKIYKGMTCTTNPPKAAAYWSFNEGSGSTAADSSGAGNTGSITGAAWKTGDQCIKGSCLSFASGNIVKASKPVTLGTQFSISHWIKTTATGSQTYTIGNAGGGDGYRFGIEGGAVSFLSGNTAGYSEGSCGKTLVNDNQWHHIVGVYDSGKTFTCYVDGKLDGTVTIKDFTGMQTSPPGIGAPPCCKPFVGLIDEVKMYNRLLTATEIAADHSANKPIVSVPTSATFAGPITSVTANYPSAGVLNPRTGSISFRLTPTSDWSASDTHGFFQTGGSWKRADGSDANDPNRWTFMKWYTTLYFRRIPTGGLTDEADFHLLGTDAVPGTTIQVKDFFRKDKPVDVHFEWTEAEESLYMNGRFVKKKTITVPKTAVESTYRLGIGHNAELGGWKMENVLISAVPTKPVSSLALPTINPFTLRVESKGYSTPTGEGGVWVNKNKVLSPARSYGLSVLSTSGAVEFSQNYDVYGDTTQSGKLATKLNSIPPGNLVVVSTYDEPKDHRTDNGLADALYRCGASSTVFGSPTFKFRSAYLLIGVCGKGASTGIERYAGLIDDDFNSYASADASCTGATCVATDKPCVVSDFVCSTACGQPTSTSKTLKAGVTCSGGLSSITCAATNPCAAITGTCTGTAPTGPAGSFIQGPGTWKGTSVAWAFDSAATTTTACKWKCNAGFHQSGNSCAADTGTCTGTAPTGPAGSLTKGPATWTNSPAAWTYDTGATTSTSCKWKCNTGYERSTSGTACEEALPTGPIAPPTISIK